jgi:energy-coupling factor transporter ATP-binding protein EcfA2
MKLASCKFTGLEGHKTLDLTNLTDLVVLTGPNASGKTTILRILHFALELLSKKTICEVIEGNDSWYKFESAQIAFQLPQLVSLAQIHASWFPEPFRELSIALTCTAKNFTVTSIRCGDRELTLAARTCTRKELVTSQNQLTDLENRLGAAEQAMSKPSQPKGPDPAFARLRQESTREIERLNKEITQKRAEITKQSSVQIKLSGSEEEGSSTRDQIDALMADLNLPESYYVEISSFYGKIIPELITRLLKQKKGRAVEEEKFRQVRQRLEHLIQGEVDFSEVDGKEDLHVDGVPYPRASAGTQVTLAYFGITHLERPDRIIFVGRAGKWLAPNSKSSRARVDFG